MTEEKPTRSIQPVQIIVFALALLGLSATSQHSYLLFHSVAELFSIVVAFGVFIVSWSARRSMNNGYLLFIGIGFLYIAGLDTLHTLAFKGMGVFGENDANLPTQLWIASRYLQSLILLAAPLFLRRKVNSGWVFAGFTLAAAGLIWAIFTGAFPVCYVEGVGLTPFKIISEYVISAISLGAMGLLVKNRQEFDPQVLRYLMISIGASILSEIAFTSYVSVFGFANLLGHLFKIAKDYFLFLAIIDTGFHKPFSLLLRSVKQNEDALRAAHNRLEQQVEERTQDLAHTNAQLREEIAERQRIESELKEVQRRLMDSTESERLRLARELHDGPIQDLLAAVIHLQQLRMDQDGEEGNRVAFVQDLLAQISQTLRTICGELRPQALAPFGLEKAIRSHAGQLHEEHPELTLDLDLTPDGKALPESTRMALYRIYQQSVNNVIRHSKARHIRVRFNLCESEIRLEVQDNGDGFDVPDRWIQLVREGHLGLAGMSERAEAIGGKMSVFSWPGEGTRIEVTVPRNGHEEKSLEASSVRF